MELRWITSLSASALHAAEQLITYGKLVDTGLEEAIRTPSDRLKSELLTHGLECGPAFDYLPALAAEIPNNRELIDVLMRKLRGLDTPSPVLEALAGRISDLETAVLDHASNTLDELALRSKPLRQQWEARGPGMLLKIQDLLGDNALTSRASVIVVAPVRGGGGRAHPQHNAVRIEAVLANPLPSLPEVARLGWMLSQLHWDLPIFSERIARSRRDQIISLAAIPPALTAAHRVELTGKPMESIPAAVEAWLPAGENADRDSAVLSDWWNTYLDAPTSWPVALTALDRMLA